MSPVPADTFIPVVEHLQNQSLDILFDLLYIEDTYIKGGISKRNLEPHFLYVHHIKHDTILIRSSFKCRRRLIHQRHAILISDNLLTLINNNAVYVAQTVIGNV